MKNTMKRIMVPTDFSDCSESAVDHAVDLAQRFGARLLLLHVLEAVVYGVDFTLTQPTASSDLRQRLIELMQERVEGLRRGGIDAEGHFVTGIPSSEIIKAAQKHEVDLIVMGTHGRTGLAHVLLGSTAERVIQRAHCPVLTVKLKKQAEIPASVKEKALQAKEAIGITRGVTYCHLCAQPSEDIICEACKVRVQAESFEHKRRIEKEGRVETGRR